MSQKVNPENPEPTKKLELSKSKNAFSQNQIDAMETLKKLIVHPKHLAKSTSETEEPTFLKPSPAIEVQKGKIIGVILHSYYAFLGVPYARPPIGDLRFSPPQPLDPWTETLDTNIEPNICLQYDVNSKKVIGSEDCLYLNVFTPKLPGCCPKMCNGPCTTLLPVMFHIHSGGFFRGNGIKVSEWGPDLLVKKNVVLVSASYRLNVLGYLSLDRKEAPGNMGLKDQVMALKWVRANISKFCGDPKNITIFGLDAGGASVNFHMLSSMSKGLFHKAIAQSGSALHHWAFNKDVKELAFKMADHLKLNISDEDELLKYLKSMPGDQLVDAAASVTILNETKSGVLYGFVPTVEKPKDWKPFLDSLPYDILRKNTFNKVPLITGFCSNESIILAAQNPNIFRKITTDDDLVENLPFVLNDSQRDRFFNWLKSIYFSGKSHKVDDNDIVDYFTDINYLGGIVVLATMIAKSKTSPVYLYEFCYEGVLNISKFQNLAPLTGPAHGDDRGYLFKLDVLKEPTLPADIQLRERMVEMWTAFAKYGDPTPILDMVITTKWLPVSNYLNMEYLMIDKVMMMVKDPYPERMAIFQELYDIHRVSKIQ